MMVGDRQRQMLIQLLRTATQVERGDINIATAARATRHLVRGLRDTAKREGRPR